MASGMRLAACGLLLAALGGCGRSAPTLAGARPVAHWVEALRGADARLRRQAAFKLGNVGAADPAALPALVAALHDPDAAVRREAVLALLKCGPATAEAVPALADLRDHDVDPKVRTAAASALERLQGGK